MWMCSCRYQVMGSTCSVQWVFSWCACASGLGYKVEECVLESLYTAKLVQNVSDMIFPSSCTKCVIMRVSGMIARYNLVQIILTVCATMWIHSGTYHRHRVPEWSTYEYQTEHIVYQSWVILELREQIDCKNMHVYIYMRRVLIIDRY